MFRMTTLKMSLLSALATLFLLVAMLASSGTASAHTASAHTAASCQPQVNPACGAPQLEVLGLTPIKNTNCKSMTIVGSHFAPGQVTLQAQTLGFFGHQLSVYPTSSATVDAFNGGFYITRTICGYGFGSPVVAAKTPGILVAIESNGVQSNQARV